MALPHIQPLLPSAVAAAPASLLGAVGRYDLRAIMRQAHAEARAEQARHAGMGIKSWPYALHLKHALHSAWGDARVYAICFHEEARLAAMLPEVANLIRERAIALHIDSLPAMARELAAIDARAAAIGVRL